MNEAQFVLKTEKFEGPLNLLLSLIQSRKLHISEISLASVVDDFIAHVEQQPVEEKALSEFLSIISTLLLIKARSLFPGIKLTEAEEQQIEELQENIKRYEFVQKSARKILNLHGKRLLKEINGIEPLKKVGFNAFKEVSMERLRDAALAISVRIPQLSETYRNMTIEKHVQLESVISAVMSRLESTFSTTFSELTENATTKKETVLHFLAILELIKNGVLSAFQKDYNAEIALHKHSVTIPQYGSL